MYFSSDSILVASSALGVPLERPVFELLSRRFLGGHLALATTPNGQIASGFRSLIRLATRDCHENLAKLY